MDGLKDGIKSEVKLVSQPLAVMEAKWPKLFMAITHHRTTGGDAMIFVDKPWLEEIYKDDNDRMVIIKCSQVHMTEHFICAMFTLARRGLRGIYILPTNEHRRPFVADRINRLKDNSPQYRNAVKEAGSGSDSNVYKTIFGEGWKFCGANVKRNFFEFPADVLIMDEFDLLDQDNIQYAYDRLANSDYPHIFKFGNPTSEGVGIDREWRDSNQCEWFVKCHHCGAEQILDWYRHFVEKDGPSYKLRHSKGYPICTNCHKPFDRCGAGRWIAQKPESTISGYRISRLFVNKSSTDIVGHPQDSLYVKFKKAVGSPTKMMNFHNNYLGVTFDNYEYKLTEALMQKAAAEVPVEFESNYRTLVGIDQGRLFTVVISVVVDGVLYDVSYTVCNTWDELEALITTMNAETVVIDAQGGGYADTRAFVRRQANRWMCYYRPKDQVKTEYNLKYEENVVETNRTEILDTMVNQFRDDKIVIRSDWKSACAGAYADEMQVPQRKVDAAGRAVWTKGTDHFFHAAAYRTLALMISGMTNSAEIKDADWYIDRDQKKVNVQNILEGGTIGDVPEDQLKPKPRKSWHV